MCSTRPGDSAGHTLGDKCRRPRLDATQVAVATGSADGAAALGSPTSPQAAGTTVCQTAHISPAPPAPPAPAAGLHTPFPARAHVARHSTHYTTHTCCAPQHAYTTHTYTHSLSLCCGWSSAPARLPLRGCAAAASRPQNGHTAPANIWPRGHPEALRGWSSAQARLLRDMGPHETCAFHYTWPRI